MRHNAILKSEFSLSEFNEFLDLPYTASATYINEYGYPVSCIVSAPKSSMVSMLERGNAIAIIVTDARHAILGGAL